MRIKNSTDKKRIGESISIVEDHVIFQDGSTMAIEKDQTIGSVRILSNSNYIITIEVE